MRFAFALIAHVPASAAAAAAAAAQDHAACHGIYCPQTKAADYAAEFGPYVAADKTWEQVKGRNVLVLKYYDRTGALASVKTYPQTRYMEPAKTPSDGIAFAGQGTPTIALYGLSPCKKPGNFDFKGQTFTCDTLWQDRLETSLYATQAVICRAYTDQIDKPVQDATCLRADEGFGTKTRGGAVIDDNLVGLGVAVIDKDASGKPLRPELVTLAARGARTFDAITAP